MSLEQEPRKASKPERSGDNSAYSRYERQTASKVAREAQSEAMQKLEESTEIEFFLEENIDEFSHFDASKKELTTEISEIQKRLQFESPTFSLQDHESVLIVKSLLKRRFEYNERRDGFYEWESKQTNALTANDYLDTLQKQGLDNTDIIRKLLTAHDNGEINILPQKLEQYRNFITLLTDSDFAEDRLVIEKVINSPSVNLDDPNSFVQVLQSLSNRTDISELTKVKLAERFHFRKLATGHDLKANLSSRKQELSELRRSLAEIEQNRTALEEERTLVEEEANKLQEDLKYTNDPTERQTIEARLVELQERLADIDEGLRLLDEIKAQTILPPDSVPVRMGRATVIDGIIHLRLPGSDRELVLPELERGQLVGQVVNSYFVYENLRSLGLHRALFPNHILNNQDLPSAEIVNKTNNLLSVLGLHNTGTIATSEDLDVLNDTLKVFRTKNDIDSKRQVNFEEGEQDLTELGLLDSGAFNWSLFTDTLEFLRTNRKPHKHSFEGVRNFLKSR